MAILRIVYILVTFISPQYRKGANSPIALLYTKVRAVRDASYSRLILRGKWGVRDLNAFFFQISFRDAILLFI